MIGSATAHGAITIVNALPTGVGCALGISLPVTARVELGGRRAADGAGVEIEAPSDTPLVRESVREAISLAPPREERPVRVAIASEIPPARGLKSSSAVASAVVSATLRALGRDLPPVEVARVAARVGRRVGLSATGAFDDALAGLVSGFVLTDNRQDWLLSSTPVDPRLEVVLLIPPTEHRPSPEWREAFERRADESRRALEEAAQGRWAEAIRRNTTLVEEIMGYDYQALREELLDQGARACGVTGLGPTLAALVESDHADDVLEALPEGLGERRRIPLSVGVPGPAAEVP